MEVKLSNNQKEKISKQEKNMQQKNRSDFFI